MQGLLPYLIAVLATWATVQAWQVRRLTGRYEQVLRANIEQDRPLKG